MSYLIVLVVLAIVVFVISAPLRAARRPREDSAAQAGVAELEAAREAKYAEIREAELDHQMGKLSDEDYEAVDRALRTEAIEILQALDQAGAATISDR
jgi:flagellar biosynthesis/type III secretory pathway M-ring protein FliF/YscJ